MTKKGATVFRLNPYEGSETLFRLTPYDDDASRKKRRTRASLQASDRPFFIEGPAVISFSGGRTSAEMTRRILDAHDGELPDDVFVDFTNTGKEREETLVFVNECSLRWNVPITWLERTPGPHGDDIDEPRERFRVVTFETASRKGEPFDDIIRERGMVPRPRIRFCTEELKLRVMQNCMRARGYEEWDRIVGLRYDEPKRVSTIRAAGHERGDVHCPLFDAKVTEGGYSRHGKRATSTLGSNDGRVTVTCAC